MSVEDGATVEQCGRCGDFAEGTELLVAWDSSTFCAECVQRLGGEELLEAMRVSSELQLRHRGLIWQAGCVGAVFLCLIFFLPSLALVLLTLGAVSLITQRHECIVLGGGEIVHHRPILPDRHYAASDLRRWCVGSALSSYLEVRRPGRWLSVQIHLPGGGRQHQLVRSALLMTCPHLEYRIFGLQGEGHRGA